MKFAGLLALLVLFGGGLLLPGSGAADAEVMPGPMVVPATAEYGYLPPDG